MTKSEENQLNDLQKSIDHGIYMYLVFIVSPIVIFLPFKVPHYYLFEHMIDGFVSIPTSGNPIQIANHIF